MAFFQCFTNVSDVVYFYFFHRESKLKDDFEIEKTSLQNTLETTSLLLQQKEKEVEKFKNEV